MKSNIFTLRRRHVVLIFGMSSKEVCYMCDTVKETAAFIRDNKAVGWHKMRQLTFICNAEKMLHTCIKAKM